MNSDPISVEIDDMFVLVTPLDSVDESTKEEGTVEKKVPESAKEDSAEKAEEKKPSSAEQDAVERRE